MKKNKIILMAALITATQAVAYTCVNAYPSSKYNMTVAPFVGDFNGDGRDDFGMKTEKGELYIANTKSDSTIGSWDVHKYNYGDTNSYPLVGDFDGDGKADFAVRTKAGEVYIDYSRNGFDKYDYYNTGYGGSDDFPFVGDFNGDGKDDLGIRGYYGDIYIAFSDVDGSIGKWDYHNTGYGGGNDYISFVGDFNGDGKDDFGMKRIDGQVFLAYTDADGSIGKWDYINTGYGGSDAYPIIGDFNGDGKDDYGMKSDGGDVWIAYTNPDNTIGQWDYHSSNYGMTDSYPFVGDFNGDGKDDFGVKTDGGDVWLAYTDGNGVIGSYDYHNNGYGINEVPGTIHKTQQEIDREKVVDEAKKYLGIPYVYGGEDPSGFDCSGLVQYVYKKALGINLSRTTYTQINEGRQVSQSELLPGDLVFPHDGHVQLYIGNGQVIHAPQTGDVVKISNLYKFKTARRIIG